MWLTQSEIIELTGKSRRKGQVQVLGFMGIQNKVRPDGVVIVLRAHVEQVFGLRDAHKEITRAEPNWSALN